MSKFKELIWRNKEIHAERPPPEELPNLGDDIRKVAENKEVCEKANCVSPLIMGTMVAWPVYWLIRGIDWNRKKRNIKLPVFIKNTFYQAKCMTLLILTTGLLFAIINDPDHTIREPPPEDA